MSDIADMEPEMLRIHARAAVGEIDKLRAENERLRGEVERLRLVLQFNGLDPDVKPHPPDGDDYTNALGYQP